MTQVVKRGNFNQSRKHSLSVYSYFNRITKSFGGDEQYALSIGKTHSCQ